MTIATIKSTLAEISLEAETIKDEHIIEQLLNTLDDLVTQLDTIIDDIDDFEYQKISEKISDTQYNLQEILEDLADEENYGNEEYDGDEDEMGYFTGS
jgi:hypothetical protein